jgi:hypothetical protein
MEGLRVKTAVTAREKVMVKKGMNVMNISPYKDI